MTPGKKMGEGIEKNRSLAGKLRGLAHMVPALFMGFV